MKSSKKALALALAAAMVVTAIPATNANAATTGLSAKKATVYVGGSKTLTVKTPKSWKSVKVTASTSNKKVAKVKKISNKKVKVTAVKAGTAKVKVKVTYKKSTKKNAKKYTKTYTCKTTVKNVAFSVKASTKTLKVGETSKLTVKKTPASANIKYSSSDPAVATVAKGVITANGVGKAVISAKFTYGTKKITKKITINVTEAVSDGVAVSLKNQFSADYPDTVVTYVNGDQVNDAATLRVYYGENNKGVKNENILVNYKYGSESKSSLPHTKVTRTDDNGVAYIDIPASNVEKVSYTITTERDKTIVKEGTFSFAEIATDDIDNINGVDKKDKVEYKKAGYNDLKVSENDIQGSTKGTGRNYSAGTATHKESNDQDWATVQYVRDYVTSQQVSPKGTTENKVGFVGGLPYIYLPGDSSALNEAKNFQQDVNITDSTDNTYENASKYVTLSVNPNELTYATMNFTSLSLSKYTRLEVAAYPTEADAKDGKNQIGSTTEVFGPSTQNNFAYQIPLSVKNYNSLCIKVTLKSQGQVSTDSKMGYTIKDITGVYKSKTTDSDMTKTLLKGASISWKKTDATYSNEKTLDASDIAKAYRKGMFATEGAGTIKDSLTVGNKDEATGKIVKKVTYRVPVFPYTGNAIVTTYDKNGSVIGYFAWPTVNYAKPYTLRDGSTEYEYTNENVLNFGDNGREIDNSVKYVYRISEDEAFKSVGTVSQEGQLVTVNAENAGVTNLVGTITGVDGLDATNSTVYTSVQWNPVQNATLGSTGAIAFTGQEATVVAQLVDNNGNAVASAGKNIDFKYLDYTASPEVKSITTNNLVGKTGTASVLDRQATTDSKGQAKLLLSAANAGTVIEQIQASTSSYNVVIYVDGKKVDKLDVYWIDAHSAFGVTASEEPSARLKDQKIDNPTVDSSGAFGVYCQPTIGENWKYAFTTADEFLPNAGVWANNKVTISNAKISVEAESDSKGTVKAAGNGEVFATSKESGETTLVGTVDGSAATKDGVTFTVNKPVVNTFGAITGYDKVTDTKNIGTGVSAFSNQQKLVIHWAQAGVNGVFVPATGFNATSGSAFTMYFKVQDKFGNANTADTVKVKSNETITDVQNGTYLGENYEYRADQNGIVKIKLAGLTAGKKALVTVTLNGTAYTQVVTWKDAKTPKFDNRTVKNQTTATSTDTWKSYADNSKIVLTFDQDILASSVIADEFKVYRDSVAPTNLCEIGSVTVSGKSIIITLKHPVTDGMVKPFTVQMNTKTVDGVDYNVTTTNGDVINTTSYVINNSTGTQPSATGIAPVVTP